MFQFQDICSNSSSLLRQGSCRRDAILLNKVPRLKDRETFACLNMQTVRELIYCEIEKVWEESNNKERERERERETVMKNRKYLYTLQRRILIFSSGRDETREQKDILFQTESRDEKFSHFEEKIMLKPSFEQEYFQMQILDIFRFSTILLSHFVLNINCFSFRTKRIEKPSFLL